LSTILAKLGIGSAHDGPTPTFDSLSAALRTALTPETRARARAVARPIRTDGATVGRPTGGADCGRIDRVASSGPTDAVSAALQADPLVRSVSLVGSRADGTATTLSDWDYHVSSSDRPRSRCACPT
jgi:hypothetical protein